MGDPSVLRVLEVDRLSELGPLDVRRHPAWMPKALLHLRDERAKAQAQRARTEAM